MSIVSLYSYKLDESRQQIKICLCHFANMFFLQIRQRYIFMFDKSHQQIKLCRCRFANMFHLQLRQWKSFMFDKSIRAIAAILVNDADQ